MPLPTVNDFASLSYRGEAINYLTSADKYVFNKLPMRRVMAKSATYHIWDRADALRVMAEPIGDYDEAPLIGQRLSTDSYDCEAYGAASGVPPAARAEAAARGIDLKMAKTRFLTDQAMRKAEKLLHTDVLTTSKFTGSTTGSDINPGTVWTAGGGAAVAADVLAQVDSVELKTGGYRPDVFWLTRDVHTQLRLHPNFKDPFESAQGGPVTNDRIASVLGMRQILIAAVSENTAAEGLTASYSRLGSEEAAVLYLPNSPLLDTDEPSALQMFAWDGLGDRPREMGINIREFRNEGRDLDMLEVTLACDFKVTGADLGAFFTDTLT